MLERLEETCPVHEVDHVADGLRVQTKQYMGEKLYASIGYHKENIKSFHKQAKGHRVQPADACYHCKLEYGPYTSCIVFVGMVGEFKPCANCWWGKQVVRCSFMKSTDLGDNSPVSSVPTIEPSQCHLGCAKKKRAATHMDIQQQEDILSQQEAVLSQQKAILAQQKAILLAQKKASLAQLQLIVAAKELEEAGRSQSAS